MQTLLIIFPVFAIAILGYLLTALRIFRVDDIPGLARYVFNVALPVMLFDSMSTLELPESIRWSFLIAYYGPTLGLYALSALGGAKAFRHTITESGVFAMGCAYSNTVLIGLPVITTAWGDQALLPLMIIITLHSGIMFSLVTAVAESGRNVSEGTKQSFKETTQEEAAQPVGRTVQPARSSRRTRVRSITLRTTAGMARNPIVVGLMVGLAFNLLAIPVPETVRTITGWIRASAMPTALFVTGASLRRYHLMGHLPETAAIVVVKLFVHPFLVWVLASVVLGLPPLWTGVAVVTAALPTGINASVFAAKYHATVAPVTGAILVTTALSIVTLSILLALPGFAL